MRRTFGRVHCYIPGPRGGGGTDRLSDIVDKKTVVLQPKCVYVQQLAHRKCVEYDLITKQFASPIKQKIFSSTRTVLPEFLVFYLLLYTVYSGK